MRTQQMKVVAHSQIAPGIREIRLDCEENFVFQAGQYVLVHIGGTVDPTLKKPYPRAYSIASFEGEITSDGSVSANQITLIYKDTGGVATSYLSHCVVGDMVTIQGPAGYYTTTRHSDQNHVPLVFCATGTGIAPIHCILKSLSILNSPFPIVNSQLSTINYQFQLPPTIHLFWGLRTLSDLYLVSSFGEIVESLLQKGVRVECSLCVSQEKVAAGTTYEQWNVFGSRVQPVLIEKIGTSANTLFSLCGSGEMVTQTRQLLLANGVNPKQILFERYS
ncbi:MAG: FAD-dependent oxidoreductase [bacterium]